MKIIAAVFLMILIFCGTVTADNRYLVVEGSVDSISAKTLEINKLFYSVSPYAQVFDANNKPLTLAEVANIGHINKARVFLFDGKVVKIIVITILQ
jgi:hypothetical protein